MRWENRIRDMIRYEAPDAGVGSGGDSGVSEASSPAATDSAPVASSISDDILSLFKQEFGGEGQAEQSVGETPQASSPETSVQEPGTEHGESQVESKDESKASPTENVGNSVQSQGPDLQKALADSLATIKSLQEQLSAQAKEKEAAKQEAPASDPVFDSDPADLYNYQIPPVMYNALFSSESTPEERVQALQGFAKAISVNTHRQLMNSLGNWTKENFNAVPRVVEYMLNKNQQVAQAKSSIKDSFYKEFPDLQRPELNPLLKATIQQVQAETKATAWSPAMQKQVGTRMRALLASFAPKQAPAPAPTLTPTAVKPEAPKVQTLDPNGSDAIAATLANIF